MKICISKTYFRSIHWLKCLIKWENTRVYIWNKFFYWAVNDYFWPGTVPVSLNSNYGTHGEWY